MPYKRCTKCVMDTTDPQITFDLSGVCNHCIEFEKNLNVNWFPNKQGQKKLKKIIDRIKEQGKNNEYDCILGLSGGIDSSYLALKVNEMGLRPLVVHVDAGWNTELASNNIKVIVEHCSFDLFTHVVNWKEMRDLQLAYLKSSISNLDVPQDHVFFSTLYHFAIKHKIKYLISGGNIATEGVLPNDWQVSAMDSINLKAIHKKFGERKLEHYQTISFFKYYFLFPFFYKFKTVRPLNYMYYNKDEAREKLISIGYKPYNQKHGESIWTKFFQSYIQPTKFNIDKRKAHLSSLILSSQISRKEALNILNEKPYDQNTIEFEKDFIAKKLNISKDDLETYLKLPNKNYKDFKNWDKYRNVIGVIKLIFNAFSKKNISPYS